MSRAVRLTTSVCVLVPVSVSARRPSMPDAPHVPTVEEVVRAEGFEPTPSQTELYRPGAVLVPNARGGHDAVVGDCIGVEPAVSIMSQSSIATTLSAGVSTRLGVGTAAASAGVEKRLTFIDPEQRTISLGLMQATDDCKAQLSNAARFQDLSEAIVVNDVLVAIIQNTVCTRVDAKGGVVALGEAEAAAYSECVQESDAQVPLGFKSVPLDRLVAATAAVEASVASPGLDFGSSADLGVEARLREQECAKRAEAEGVRNRERLLSDARTNVRQQATAAWKQLEPEASACVKLPRADRVGCVQAVERWLQTADRMAIELPAGVETVQTSCGAREAAFPAKAEVVAADEVSTARSLLRRLQTAADPKTASVAVSSGVSSASSGHEAQLAEFMTLRISGPQTERSAAETNKVLKDQLVRKAKALGSLERTLVSTVSAGEPTAAVDALVLLGRAYEDMAESLTGSYIPRSLTADQVELYKMSLDDKALVQVEKAIHAYATAMNQAHSAGVYSQPLPFALARLSALRPADYPPMHEPLDRITDAALAPSVEALRYWDYTAAERKLSGAKGADGVQTDLIRAVVACGQKDFDRATKIYRKQLASSPDHLALVGFAGAFYTHHLKNYKQANKVYASFVDASRGKIGPDHVVFSWMEASKRAQAAAKQEKAQQAAAQKAGQERRARQSRQLQLLEGSVAELTAFHRAHTSCSDYMSAIGEEVAMVLEQAQMVIEAEEADMAGDVQAFVDQVEPMAKEIAATCR